MQIFRKALREISKEGRNISIEILGSISFGIVEKISDADCVLFHYCDLHADDGECPFECPNFIFESNHIRDSVKRELKEDSFNIEFLDCLNLSYVERLIETDQVLNNDIIHRLLYYRTLGRPVNRPLICRYTEKLEENEELMQEFKQWSSEALASYLKTSTHRLSFIKYNERIQCKGLVLPGELKEELQKYLE